MGSSDTLAVVCAILAIVWIWIEEVLTFLQAGGAFFIVVGLLPLLHGVGTLGGRGIALPARLPPPPRRRMIPKNALCPA